MAKEAPEGTLKHEAGHFAFQFALTPEERDILLRDYGSEEKAIHAYDKWEPTEPHGIFQKVYDFFQNLYRSFFPNSESIFKGMREGEVWRRPAADAFPESRPMYRSGLHDFWDVLKSARPKGRPTGDQQKAHHVLREATVKAIAPEIQSKEAMRAAELKVKALGEARSEALHDANVIKDWTVEMGKMDYDDRWKLRARMEKGEDVGPWTAYRDAFKTFTDKTWKRINEIRDGAVGYRDFYARHLYANPDKAGTWLGSGGGRGFLKEGFYPNWDAARKAGHEPLFDNPVHQDMATLMEQHKFIGLNDWLDLMKKEGLYLEPKAGEPFTPAEGWAQSKPGQYRAGWAPQHVMDVVNNYFSGGQGNLWYSKYRNFMSLWNALHVGFSAFHAMTSLASTIGMGIGRGVPEFIGAALSGDHGKMATALREASPIHTVIDVVRMSKQGTAEWLKPGSMGGRVADLVRIAAQGGIIPKEHVIPMGELGAQTLAEIALQLKGGELGRAVRSSIYYAGKPIMGVIVPTVKYGSTLLRMNRELDRLTERYNRKYGSDWSPEVQANFQKDTMTMAYNERQFSDSIFGEIHPDNLHWNRAFSEGMKGVIAYPSWNLGTFRWIGGMIRGVYQTATGQKLDYQSRLSLQFGLGLAITTALANTMLHFSLNNGQAPEDWQDVLVGARTGRYLSNGSQERVTIASYMKDIFGLAASTEKAVKEKGVFGFATGPIQFTKAKLQAPIQMYTEILNNADYFGREIFPERGGVLEKSVGGALGLGRYLGEKALPFGFSGLSTPGKEGITAWGPFVGFRPVSRYLVNTSAMNRIDRIMERESPKARTAEAVDNSRMMADLKEKGWQGDREGMEEGIRAAREQGLISPIQAKHIRQAVTKDKRVVQFGKVRQLEDAIEVYGMGTPEERALWRRDLASKWSRATPEKKRKLREEYQEAMALEVAEQKPERVPPRGGFSILNQ